MPLNLQKKGFCGVIDSLTGDPVIVERLHELGFLSGQVVTLLLKTPFAGPFIVKVNDVTVALRSEEAACIEVLESPSL
ncbi:MAG: ferrous iron transport protein A [Bdellovibrionales bacterium]|nr:ferrous iron transport protein A [Bdellovibrionales bacterium]